MKTILLSGYKRSGKDTAAAWLVKNEGYKQLSFASALKDEVAAQYLLDRDSLDNQDLKEKCIMFMPAVVTDDTSRLILTYFLKELVFRDGTKPVGGMVVGGRLEGLRSHTSQAMEQLYFSRRSIMIVHGALKRSINPNYWVDVVGRQLKQHDKVVISDWRFKNEMDCLSDWCDDILTVRINRGDSVSSDPSERDLDNCDFDVMIDNTGSLEQLYKQLRKL